MGRLSKINNIFKFCFYISLLKQLSFYAFDNSLPWISTTSWQIIFIFALSCFLLD